LGFTSRTRSASRTSFSISAAGAKGRMVRRHKNFQMHAVTSLKASIASSLVRIWWPVGIEMTSRAPSLRTLIKFLTRSGFTQSSYFPKIHVMGIGTFAMSSSASRR
jgi:hypothetical protein